VLISLVNVAFRFKVKYFRIVEKTEAVIP